jgi:hypothetical protein
MLFTWKAGQALPIAPLVMNCDVDFFRRERAADANIAGPFQALAAAATVMLPDGFRPKD